MNASSALVALLLLLVGVALGAALGALSARSRGAARVAGLQAQLDRERDVNAERLALARADESRERRVTDLVAPVADSLGALSRAVQEAEQARLVSQAELREQLRAAGQASEQLRAETGRLGSALRRSEVRGRWGEMQLRRLVETAGMIEHVHFTEQAHTATDDGALRPDLVVHLAYGKNVVVDAKAPLDAYLEAVATDDEEAREAHLRRHAAALGAHIDRLAAKDYAAVVDGSPEFVVLFLPAEPLLSAALTADPSLLERAFARDVVLATPTTLGALLRTVQYGWRQEAVAANARELHDLGRELHGRLATLGDHLGKVGTSLDAAVRRYNAAVSSLESRVLVSARRFSALGVTDDPLEAPAQVTSAARIPGAPEFESGYAEVVLLAEGEPGREDRAV
jgi:DNA recombination protein RmuC